MDKIILKDFRCFHSEQSARLAPLTLFVGENSTGKTSLMAMIRALTDIARGGRNPDFKEDPYDLGSFDEIAHRRGAGGGQAKSFKAGISSKRTGKGDESESLEVTFGKSGTIPVPIRRRFSSGKTWMEVTSNNDESYSLQVGTRRGSWKLKFSDEGRWLFIDEGNILFPRSYLVLEESLKSDQANGINLESVAGAPSISSEDRTSLRKLAFSDIEFSPGRPFAGAPVRSKPHRTYDPSRPYPDPEGDYVPMYLADVFLVTNRLGQISRANSRTSVESQDSLMKSLLSGLERGGASLFRC